MYSVQD